MKRLFFRAAAALLAAVLFLSVHAGAVSARSAIVMDATTGRVLFEKDCDRKSLIASTTKIMTALLICEKCNVLDQMRIPKEAVGIEGSSMYLREAEVLTLQELLYGLMLSSGNDAAVALALYCSGSIEEFAEQMNDKARALGMSQTHFENPNGLDSENHYSTARDLGILAVYAMENPIFAKTVSTKSVTIGDRFLKNHNKLLWMYPDADGIKTGYTRAAGRILVSSAVRDRRRLIAVTIHAPDDWRDHMQLLDETFSGFNLQRIVTVGDCVGYRDIVGGTKQRVPLLAAENYLYSVSKDEHPQLLLPKTGLIYAPVAEGADAGFVYVILSGKVIDKLPVVYGETSEQNDSEEKSSSGGNPLKQRLQKILSNCGITSRRKAEEMIRAGNVAVNGVAASVGDMADPESDVITVEGKPIPSIHNKKIYIMLNKPRGYVTTLSDEKGRPTAASLVSDCDQRVYPVGRLDMDSEGLLLFTNDGDFANRMMHPSKEVNKTYFVKASGYTEDAFARLEKPIVLDGYRISPPIMKQVQVKGNICTFEITIHEGRNRQIRRMCDAAGMRVLRLKRIQEGALKLDKLPLGKWRFLTEEEIQKIIK